MPPSWYLLEEAELENRSPSIFHGNHAWHVNCEVKDSLKQRKWRIEIENQNTIQDILDRFLWECVGDNYSVVSVLTAMKRDLELSYIMRISCEGTDDYHSTVSISRHVILEECGISCRQCIHKRLRDEIGGLSTFSVLLSAPIGSLWKHEDEINKLEIAFLPKLLALQIYQLRCFVVMVSSIKIYLWSSQNVNFTVPRHRVSRSLEEWSAGNRDWGNASRMTDCKSHSSHPKIFKWASRRLKSSKIRR